MDLAELYKLIKRFEGCRLKAYLCPAGVWTIGWGSTGPGIVKGVVWTQAQADARLEKDAMVYAQGAAALSPVLLFDDLKLCAIADFCYNLGVSRYKISTLRKRVNAGDWEGACTELMKWTRGGGRVLPGLVLRCQARVDLVKRSVAGRFER